VEATDTSDDKWAESLIAAAPETPTEAEDEQPEVTADAPEAEDQTDVTPDDDEAPADVQEQPRFKVRVDGEEREVTLEELQRGYAGQGYIQKQMQEVAAERKRAAEFVQTLQTEQAQVLQLAQQLQQTGILPPPVPPPAELAARDTNRYIRELASYNEQAARYQVQQSQIQAVRQRQAEIDELNRAHEVAQAAEQLKAAIPDFADPQKADAIKADLLKIGRDVYGYAEEDLLQVTDPRAVRVLHDAAQWRKLQAQKAAPNRPAIKNVQPAAKRPEPPQLAQAKIVERAKKSGRDEDWAEALLVRK
jgi:myosin heavy subunit